MSRHSKNNTASSVFTYHERQQLQYGTKTSRLGSDSMRDFDACFLCLQTARDPICCTKGHLACKECFYENILAQKKEIARQQKEAERIVALREAQAAKRELEAHQLLLDEFEKSQTHFLPVSRLNIEKSTVIEADRPAEEEGNGKERKPVDAKEGDVFQLDVDEMRARSKDEKERALAALESEEAERTRPKLPSFWIPSLTPGAKGEEVAAVKVHTECTGGDRPHPVTIKKLFPVRFTTAEAPNDRSDADVLQLEKLCPSCTKTIVNSTKLAASKTCGHVLCKKCFIKFMKQSGKCFVCNAKCKAKDIVEFSGEGTGYAAGGKAEAKKEDVAFQC